TGPPGNITLNVNTFSASDSGISASVPNETAASSGAVTIQGLQGSGTDAHSVSLTNTTISTSNTGIIAPLGSSTEPGPILIRADNIAVNHSGLNASVLIDGNGGSITLVSRGNIDILNSNISVRTDFDFIGGKINLEAGKRIDAVSTFFDAHSLSVRGGTIN